MQGNYVPVDELSARSQVAEYDVILALSLTKWVHLNWGDAGIQRFFQKVYAHLRPGGKFILEPQPFSSYSKKKKLTVGLVSSVCLVWSHSTWYHMLWQHYFLWTNDWYTYFLTCRRSSTRTIRAYVSILVTSMLT